MKLCNLAKKCFVFVINVLLTGSCYANSGVIPTPPSTEQLNGDQDFLGIIGNVFKDELAPLLVYGGAVFLVGFAIYEIIHGMQEARKRQDWSIMKGAVLSAALACVVGIALAYLGYYIFSRISISA